MSEELVVRFFAALEADDIEFSSSTFCAARCPTGPTWSCTPPCTCR
jgi:hypothetical protein